MLSLLLAPFLAIPLTVEALHLVGAKEAAFYEALELSEGKGIVNVGCGPHRSNWAYVVASNPNVSVNVDIVLDGMPNFLQADIEHERLPFADKQFGCALASHVLEHLYDWEFALNEMVRVADHVVIVLPDPVAFIGWIDPEHHQHFSAGDIRTITERYPSVEVFY